MNPRLAVVVLNYNDSETTFKLITNIQNYSVINKIVIVDNCSTDDSYTKLLRLQSSKVDIIKSDRNGGYGYGNNYGINYLNKYYEPMYILISNPDIEVEEAVLEKMLSTFKEDDKIAVVAPFMLNRDGKKESGTAWSVPSKLQYILSAELLFGHFFKPSRYKGIEKRSDVDKMEVDCVAGSLLMVKSSLMKDYGMYDENIFLFGEETTLGCKFKKAGLKTILLLQDTFLHLHGISINRSINSKIEKRKLMLNSRLYILKQYLSANHFELLLAAIVYKLSILEYRIMLIIKGKR